MQYFYTYKLPFSDKAIFHYWKAKDSDEALGLAFSFYKTTEFYIGTTNRANYLYAKSGESKSVRAKN